MGGRLGTAILCFVSLALGLSVLPTLLTRADEVIE
jgi:hypothetical protein